MGVFARQEPPLRTALLAEVGSGSDFLDVKEAKLGPNGERLGKNMKGT